LELIHQKLNLEYAKSYRQEHLPNFTFVTTIHTIYHVEIHPQNYAIYQVHFNNATSHSYNTLLTNNVHKEN